MDWPIEEATAAAFDWRRQASVSSPFQHTKQPAVPSRSAHAAWFVLGFLEPPSFPDAEKALSQDKTWLTKSLVTGQPGGSCRSPPIPLTSCRGVKVETQELVLLHTGPRCRKPLPFRFLISHRSVCYFLGPFKRTLAFFFISARAFGRVGSVILFIHFRLCFVCTFTRLDVCFIPGPSILERFKLARFEKPTQIGPAAQYNLRSYTPECFRHSPSLCFH